LISNFSVTGRALPSHATIDCYGELWCNPHHGQYAISSKCPRQFEAIAFREARQRWKLIFAI